MELDYGCDFLPLSDYGDDDDQYYPRYEEQKSYDYDDSEDSEDIAADNLSINRNLFSRSVYKNDQGKGKQNHEIEKWNTTSE